VATLISEILKELQGRGHKIRLITPEQKGSKEYDASVTEIEISRYPLYENLPRLLALPLRTLKARRLIRKKIAKKKPDLILCAYANLDGLLALKTRGDIPFCVFCYGTELLRPAKKSEFIRNIISKVLNTADKIFTISACTNSLVTEKYNVPAEKTQIIPLGVPLEMLDEEKKVAPELFRKLGTTPKILSIAHLGKRKGLDLLIAALALLENEHLFIIGKGQDKERLEGIRKEKKISNRVHFLDSIPQKELTAYLQNVDLFVLPSRSIPDEDMEGFGLVFLEANARGLAVIGGDSGGIPDAIEDGVTGLLCPSEPTDKNIKILSEKIQKLLNDKKRCQKMAEAGKKRIREKYNWKNCVDEIEATLKSIGEQKNG
jgi:phosphatidylinositol alpha-1,6-mannosyltransferase